MLPKRIDRDPKVPDNIEHLGDYIASAPGHKRKDMAPAQRHDNINALSNQIALAPGHQDAGEISVSQNDSIETLSNYIAEGESEKLDKFWIVNCPGFTELDDLHDAMVSIEAVRSKKPNIKDKTYHLMISFRPGEGEELTKEELQDIEENFAKALGFDEHQRVVGTHKNTKNYHMHVAYNMLHPQTFKKNSPGNDYAKLDRVARKMEKKYGLYVDRGFASAKAKDKEQLSSKAKDFESKTWQQSFESYIREHEDGIFIGAKEATTWQELHDKLAEFDIGIKKRGAGLALHELRGKRSIKASILGRQFSMKNLEARLGPFEPAKELTKEESQKHKPRVSYQAKPLTKHPGQDKLWRMYREGKRPQGFLKRHFSIANWKYYLMAEAYRDPMAMVTIIFYRELLHTFETSLGGQGLNMPNKVPTDVKPALHKWFNEQDWLPSGEAPLERPGQISGIGLRIDGDDRILFPMRDAKGVTWSVRAIDDKGQTTDIGEASDKTGLNHTLDRKKLLTGKDGPYNGPIILATDCSTATTLHKHTSAPVIIAANDQDLSLLAANIQQQHQDSPILIVANAENKHADIAAEEVSGRRLNAETTMALAPDLNEQVKLATPSPLDSKKLLQRKQPYKGTVILTSLRDTGAELHKETGVPVAAIDLDKDLPQTAKNIRGKHPDSEIIIMADAEVLPAQKAAKAVKGKHMTGEQVVLESSKLKKKRLQQQAKAEEQISR